MAVLASRKMIVDRIDESSHRADREFGGPPVIHFTISSTADEALPTAILTCELDPQTSDATMTQSNPRVLLSWSSGKDSAWALYVLRQQPNLEVVGLLTTFNEAFDRVAMHAVRRQLLEAQAAAVGLLLIPVMLPYPCTNEVYEDRMRKAIAEAKATGVTHIAFGDLFLADIREYRIRLLDGTGVEPQFPIWTTSTDTPALARQMLAAGLSAILTCVDPKQLDKGFVGRKYDDKLLAELPAGVDPCGERGEFHTFCYRCPDFNAEIPLTVGDVVERDGFWFADLRPSVTTCGVHPG
jgi:uncharacterized protein (TIGR00290 family)